jgi:hypothetical protein
MTAEDGFDALLRRAFELPPAPATEAGELKRCTYCGVTFRGERMLCPADGHLLVPVSDPRIGRVVAGHYRLVEKLGSGGIGTVSLRTFSTICDSPAELSGTLFSGRRLAAVT